MTAVGGRPRPAATAPLVLGPTVLAVIAEAAWISVLAGLVQLLALERTDIGIPLLAGVVALGAVAARTIGPRAGSRWPLVALGLVVGAGLIGWLASPDARAALALGVGAALAAHPGGLVVGVAMLRGFAHARIPPAEGTLGRMLGLGVPGLAFAALLGGAIAEPFRSAFLAETLAASILFVGCTILALAFARLGSIGDDQGLDWRRNPAWLALALGLLLGVLVLALPLAVVAPAAIGLIAGLALGPLIVVGLFMGLDRGGRRALLILVPVIGLIWIRSLFRGSTVSQATPAVPGASDVTDPLAVQVATIGLTGLLLVGLVATILVLAALWMRRARTEDGPLGETRVVDRGGEPDLVHRRRRPRWWRRPEPTNAAAAYVALLADLDRHPAVRRLAGETPREHATRLRAAGPDLSLDLLAADYALATDAGRTLSAGEERRALARWRQLRRRLAKRVAPVEGLADQADDAAPVTGDPMEAGRRSVRSG